MIKIHVLNIEGKTTLPIHGDGKTVSYAAGYDVVATDDPTIVGEIGRELTIEDGAKVPLYKNIQYLEYHTALKIAPQQSSNGDYCYISAYPRSSIRKYNLMLANSVGVIDNDYRGEILFSFRYIFQPEDFVIEFNPLDGGGFKPQSLLGGINWSKIYRKGDKIGQLIANQTNECEYVFVSDLSKTARGEGGHGSTDKTAEFSLHQGDGPKTLSDIYTNVGGVSVRKRYSDEMKERDRSEGAPKRGTFMPPVGIHERK